MDVGRAWIAALVLSVLAWVGYDLITVDQPQTSSKQAIVPAQPSAQETAAVPTHHELARSKAELDAEDLCRAIFRKGSVHPSTVSFPWLDMRREVTTHDGITHVRATATSKNSFNLELTHLMDCKVRDGKIVQFDAREVR